MQRKGIDKYFREKLLGYKPEYDDSLWAGIESELDQQKPKIWSKRNIVPVVMLMSFTVLLSYTGSLQSHDDKLTAVGNHASSQAGINSIAQSGNVYQDLISKNRIKVSQNLTSSAITDNGIANAVNGSHIIHINSTTGSNSVRQASYYSNLAHSVTNGLSGATSDKSLAMQPTSDDNGIEANSLTMLDKGNMYYDLVNTPRPEPGTELEMQDYRSEARQKGNAPELLSENAGWSSVFGGFAQNPAYAGAEAKYNFNSGWNASYLEKAGGGNLTSAYAYDMKIKRFGVGIYHSRALNALSLNTTSGLSASAIVANVGHGYLRVGAAATVLYKELYFSDLHFGDEADPVFGFIHSTQDKNISSRSYTNGYDAGLYYENSRLMASVTMMNINRPSFGLLENATRLDHAYKSTIGYRISLTDKLDVSPLVEFNKNDLQMTASTRLMVSYGNKVMLAVGYENFDSKSLLGNVSANAAVQVRKKVRIFSSFGRNMQYEQQGIHQNIIRAGVRFQIH